MNAGVVSAFTSSDLLALVADRVMYLGADAVGAETTRAVVVRFGVNARDDNGDETSGDMLKTPVRSASVVSGDGERCWLNLIDVDERCGTGWYCIILTNELKTEAVLWVSDKCTRAARRRGARAGGGGER